jgi:SAM-dependent methyltransferase
MSSSDPTQRFTGLAEVYNRSRPEYPPEALDYILDRCRLGSQSVAVDVGSGTGIITRLLANRGITVIGIEPNDEMRQRAMATESPSINYRPGLAEDLGLPEAIADLVVAAQAFHWFDVERSLREFARVLKPHGWVALIWNERDPSAAFTKAYGDLLVASSPEKLLAAAPQSRTGDSILKHPMFVAGERRSFSNRQSLNLPGLIARARSVSYAPRDDALWSQFQDQLVRLFTEYQRNGSVVLEYETVLYVAQRVSAC